MNGVGDTASSANLITPVPYPSSLVSALPRKATSLELGQNCEIMDLVLIRIGGYFPKAGYPKPEVGGT